MQSRQKNLLDSTISDQVFGGSLGVSPVPPGKNPGWCIGTLVKVKHERKHGTMYKYEKHFQKMYRDVGMAVPRTTETRCRNGSVQARHVIQRLHN